MLLCPACGTLPSGPDWTVAECRCGVLRLGLAVAGPSALYLRPWPGGRPVSVTLQGGSDGAVGEPFLHWMRGDGDEGDPFRILPWPELGEGGPGWLGPFRERVASAIDVSSVLSC
jgi:hypothetical protein